MLVRCASAFSLLVYIGNSGVSSIFYSGVSRSFRVRYGVCSVRWRQRVCVFPERSFHSGEVTDVVVSAR